MKATTLLKKDHAAVKKLFRAFEKADKAVEEHAVVKSLLAQLEKMTPEQENYAAKMTVLIESVEHHAGEEEDEMFPQAEKTLGELKLRELGERIEKRKGELTAEPPLARRAAAR
ncbi:MAG: hemerythrin domain-containing protein [Acidobacteriota bacterium]